MKTLRIANGDIYIDERGRSEYIEHKALANQNVANVLLMNRRPGWGSDLSNLEASPLVDALYAHRSLIQQAVSEALDALIAVQETVEGLADDERIADFSVTVAQDNSSPLRYYYYVAATTEDPESVVSQSYSVDLDQVKDPTLGE